MKFLPLFLASLIIPLFMTSCGDGDDNNEPSPSGSISVSTDSFDFNSDGGTASFTFSAPGEWDAAASDAWIKITKSNTLERDGKVDLTVEPNTARTDRTGYITLLSGASRARVTVTQKGKEPAPADPSIEVPEGYELVWNDEFDGTELNRSDWTHEVQGPGWVNNELQTYVNTAYDGKLVTEVSDGTLKIDCFKAGDGKICSGRIYVHVNSGWKYGIFEASIKLPKGKGTWPAFWMMPVGNDWSVTPWPKCGEIDIMEEVGYNPNYTSSSIHCEAYNHMIGTQKTAERLTQGAQEDFHIYRLEWTEDYIRTYVDGKMLLNFVNDGKGNISTWPFTRAFYPILNLAWGGDWGGAMGVDETCLPAVMEVDYLRVFQKK
ncbi:MAG: family 16 glycosylhydrolase [Muribaculaceae bacterium]|nr:family 16 glycosylhydrolase [Muribaculaceae bacterium]